MAQDPDELDVELLISTVEKYPEIWDKSRDIYKDRLRKRDAWKSVCCVLMPEFELRGDGEKNDFKDLLMKKWGNIRDQWMKWKKRDILRKPRKRISHLRSYIYHEQLTFLDYMHGGISSNIGTAVNHEDDASQQDDGGQTVDNMMDPIATIALNNKTTKERKEEREESSDEFETAEPDPEDRYMMFFKGILPSLSTFTEAQAVDFQLGVLQLVRDMQIKKEEPDRPDTPYSGFLDSVDRHSKRQKLSEDLLADEYDRPSSNNKDGDIIHTNDEVGHYGSFITHKMRKYTEKTRNMVQFKFSEIILNADQGQYDTPVLRP